MESRTLSNSEQIPPLDPDRAIFMEFFQRSNLAESPLNLGTSLTTLAKDMGTND